MGAHVLVVDDDPQILRMLTDFLTKRGFGVDTARDGEEGYTRALERAPDVLVTDVMMPKLDGWSLVRKLRLDPKLANLPVIFLTAVATDDARVQAFRLGADDYVNKPFKFNDLVARIEKVLGAKQPVDPKKPASSGLAGDLAQIGLSTLLVLVEMERKTGVLQLTAADGRAGKIIARDGKVIDASLDGANQASGAEAVYVMLTFAAGRFEFSVRKVDGEAKIQQSTTHLLMEGARLMDEASAPDAEQQLNEDAIAEWGEERTPVVAAAKLADSVRRSARMSIPPYSSPSISLNQLAASPTAITSTTPLAVEPAKPAPSPEPAKLESAKPEPAARRRVSPLWLVGCLVAAGAGAATFAIKPKPSASPAVDLSGDATAIGAAIDRGVAATKMRADGLAAMPMLRTAIDTDAATMQDMVSHEQMFTAAAGEIIEVFQLRNGETSSVLRVPEESHRQLFVPPGGAHVTFVLPNQIEVIASAPIKNQHGVDAGTLAVNGVVDLKDAAAGLARHTQGARIVGLLSPVVLVPDSGAVADTVKLPIATKSVPDLVLEARVAGAKPAVAPTWLAPARYAAFALAGLLLLLYVVFAVRATSARD